jgi:purine-binding chemotaxis protein CheW
MSDPLPDKTAILKARARDLAREVQAGARAEEQWEVVEFLLASERYAIESTAVREVYPLRALTPLPCTPAFVLGIVNVRGQILAVLDLRRLFDLPIQGLTELNKVVILRAGGVEVGILADVIVGVQTVPLAQIQPSLSTLSGIRKEFLKGVTAGGLVILDADKIVACDSILVHEDV